MAVHVLEQREVAILEGLNGAEHSGGELPAIAEAQARNGAELAPQ